MARSQREKKRQRESRYVRVARLAYHIAQRTLPCYSHPKSPHRYTLASAYYQSRCGRTYQEWVKGSTRWEQARS